VGQLGPDGIGDGQDAEPLDAFGPGHRGVRAVDDVLDGRPQVRVAAKVADGRGGRLALPLLPRGEGGRSTVTSAPM
jgi:hypothetical protein